MIEILETSTTQRYLIEDPPPFVENIFAYYFFLWLIMGSLREGVKKKEGYLTVRLTISIYPTPPYGQLFLVCFLSWIIILCVLQQILHKEKVIFIQHLVIPFLLAVCCCFVTKSSNSGIAEALKAMKNAFLGQKL